MVIIALLIQVHSGGFLCVRLRFLWLVSASLWRVTLTLGRAVSLWRRLGFWWLLFRFWLGLGENRSACRIQQLQTTHNRLLTTHTQRLTVVHHWRTQFDCSFKHKGCASYLLLGPNLRGKHDGIVVRRLTVNVLQLLLVPRCLLCHALLHLLNIGRLQVTVLLVLQTLLQPLNFCSHNQCTQFHKHSQTQSTYLLMVSIESLAYKLQCKA